MDPFASDGAFSQLQNSFYQGQYSAVKSADTKSIESEHALAAQCLKFRAAVALGESTAVLKQIEKSSDKGTPELSAVKALALYKKGDTAAALALIEPLVDSEPENNLVQVAGGTILQAEGRSDEALALLAKHQGNLEAVVLSTQIHLQQNRTDLAQKVVTAAKSWAQDSLLVNIAESWVGLRLGGEKYQQAFYVFEEMAQTEASTGSCSLVSQAVAELHLGRYPESEAALQTVLSKTANDPEALANSAVLAVLTGKDSAEALSTLKKAAPSHPLLADLSEKNDAFDAAAAKYSAKVAA